MNERKVFFHTHRDAWRRDVRICHRFVETDVTLRTKTITSGVKFIRIYFEHCYTTTASQTRLKLRWHSWSILQCNKYLSLKVMLLGTERDTYKLFQRCVEVPCEIDTPVIQNLRGRCESYLRWPYHWMAHRRPATSQNGWVDVWQYEDYC